MAGERALPARRLRAAAPRRTRRARIVALGRPRLTEPRSGAGRDWFGPRIEPRDGRIDVGQWSVVLPAGWVAHAEEEIDERRESAARDAPDDIPPVLLEQAVLMTDAVVLEPDRARFGFPIAVMLLGVGAAGDASIDTVADAAMEASRPWTSGTNPPVRNVRRRWDQAAGYPALSIALDVRIAPLVGSWFAGPALRLLGFDPVRVRAVIFDRADRRHLAAIGAANRGADRQLAAFDQVLASSEWTA